jgi:hypothetical protein
MKPSRIFLIAALGMTLLETAKAQPPVLKEFWSQWDKRHLEMQTSEGQRFIRFHGQRWSPSIIPVLIRDVVSSNPDEREGLSMVYGLAVTCIPDRKGCKRVIAQLQKSQDKDAASIASDFQADIEDDERGEAWPKGFKSGN